MEPDFKATVSFHKDSSLFLASVFLSLPIVIILLLFIDPLLGRATSFQEDFTSALVVLLPLLYFTVPYFIQEKRRHKAIKEGGPHLGFFFNDEALLLHPSEKVTQLIPRNSLRTFELRGSPNKLGWLSNWMEVSGDGFCVRMSFPDDYQLMELIRFLRSWKPDIVLKIDERLDRYDEYVSLAPEVHAPVPRVPWPAQTRTPFDKHVPRKPHDLVEAAKIVNEQLNDNLNFIAHREKREYWDGGKYVPFEIRYYQHPLSLRRGQIEPVKAWLKVPLKAGVKDAKVLQFKPDKASGTEVVFLVAGEEVPARYAKNRAIPGKDLWPKAVRLESVPEELKSDKSSTLECFKALLDLAKIHYEKVHDRQTGMTDAPEAWFFDHPLELRVRDAVAIFPDLKIQDLKSDDFLRFTEYPFNEDWVFEFTCRLPLDDK